MPCVTCMLACLDCLLYSCGLLPQHKLPYAGFHWNIIKFAFSIVSKPHNSTPDSYVMLSVYVVYPAESLHSGPQMCCDVQVVYNASEFILTHWTLELLHYWLQIGLFHCSIYFLPHLAVLSSCTTSFLQFCMGYSVCHSQLMK